MSSMMIGTIDSTIALRATCVSSRDFAADAAAAELAGAAPSASSPPSSPPPLTALNLQNVYLEKEGVTELADALWTNTTLTILTLRAIIWEPKELQS